MAPRKKAAPQPTLIQGAPPLAPNWAPPPPQGSVTAAFTGPGNESVAFTAPPPQGERNPFINAQWLWANGDQSNALRPVMAKIESVRQATGGRPEFQNRGGFFLDCITQRGVKVTARVNVGDQRHQRLFAKFGANLVGQSCVFRLSHPGDATKAPWTIE